MHLVTPHLLRAPGASTTDRVRLEPYDHVTYVFDVWHVLAPTRRSVVRPVRPLRVRAAVRAAGKRRVQRSALWRSWRVVEGQVAFSEDVVEIGLAAYHAM